MKNKNKNNKTKRNNKKNNNNCNTRKKKLNILKNINIRLLDNVRNQIINPFLWEVLRQIRMKKL